MPYDIRGTYSGDGNYTSLTTNISESVEGTPKLSITPAENPAHTGPLVYAVNVSAPPPDDPTGSVTISDGVGGVCTTSLTNGAGGCSIDEQASASPLTVTASYPGDPNYGSLSTSISEVITPEIPSMQFAPTTDPADGGGVTFVTLVSGTGVAPTGQVQVVDSTGVNSAATLSDGVGNCALDMGAPTGSFSLTATYPGDGNYSSASETLTDALGTSTSTAGTASATVNQTTVTATGEGSVNVLLYPSDPVGSPSFTSTGVYFDVAASQGNNFTSQIVENCNLNGGDELVWWSPTADSGAGAWLPVIGDPGPTYSVGPPACLTATLDANSSPSISQLTGTVFSVATGPISAPPIFIGGNSTAVQAATVFSDTVRTVASGAVTIHEQGLLPRGVRFLDNGNGTATISGNPGRELTTYALTLTASSPYGVQSESYFLVIGKQPVWKGGAMTLTLRVGHSKRKVLRASGVPTPALSESGALPPGITFTAMANGSASLAGDAKTAGSYSFTISAKNTLGTVSEPMTIKVLQGS